MKRIAVQLRDKCVPLTIFVEPGETEYTAFLRVFDDYFEKDKYVCEKRKTNFLLFEYKDVEFQTQMEVPMNCTTLPANLISVRFSPFESPVKAAMIPNNCAAENAQLNSEHSASMVHSTPSMGHGKRQLEFDVVNLTGELDDNEIMQPSKKIRKKGSTTLDPDAVPVAHRWTAQNFPVPQLSSRVLALLESEKEFLLNLKIFIHEIGDHFINVVSKSYSNIYQIYVEALMLKYPQIGDCAKKATKGDNQDANEPEDGGNENDDEETGQAQEAEKLVAKEFGDALSEMIQTYVNNTKARKKRKSASSTEKETANLETILRREKRPRKKNQAGTSGRGLPETAEEELPETAEGLFAILAVKKNINDEVVLRALTTFKQERWLRIFDFKKISDIIKEWPCFSHPAIVGGEFLLRVQKTQEELEAQFECALKKLSAMKNLPCSTEREKLKVLEAYETSLRQPAGRNYTKIFTVLQMDPKKTTTMPQSVDANAPIGVIYIGLKEDNILRLYVRARNQTLWSIEKPTVLEIYKSTVGCYYTFNRSYSVASKGVMDLLDYCVLNREDQTNRSSTLRDLKVKFKNLKL